MTGQDHHAIKAACRDRVHGAIVFDRRRIVQADAALFDPMSWPERSQEAERGGRGAVWFLHGEVGDAVLRHYRRGGLPGRFNRDRYLWRGAAGTRSFREFRLLARLHELDLPVPAPLAAAYWRHGLLYRADILIEMIPDTRTLAEQLPLALTDQQLWPDIGSTLARFHAEGVDHADLNAHNILIDTQRRIWLIDFDRGRMRDSGSAWQQANILRLRRSLLKLGAANSGHWHAAWQSMLDTYGSTLASPPQRHGVS